MVRTRISRAAVVDAAIAIADGEGIGALSMRRLARELGVEAMTLYNHVADKDDLHRAMVGRIWASVDRASEEPDGRAGLHRLCGTAHRALCAHPWFFALSLPGTGGAERLAVIEATLGHLAAAGLGAERRFHALHVIDGFVYGYSWQAAEFAGDGALPDPAALAALLAPYPLLEAHARDHVAPPVDDGFTVGLDALLDGLVVR